MGKLTGENLTYHYNGKRVVCETHIALTRGKVHVLVGPSGAGKTTLLHMMAGLLPPDAGRVMLCDDNEEPRVIDRAGAICMGMVFQQPALWDHLSAAEHLDLVLRSQQLSREQRRQRIEQMLERLDLHECAKRRPGQLSGGQQQRLAIARAMIIRPPWLILDEPLAHLDGPARSELFRLLRDLLAELDSGVLVATHQTHEALRLADELTVMIDGRIVQHGTAEHVYRHPANLTVAQMLGPACQVEGVVRDGRLYIDDVPAIAHVTAWPAGPATMIVRPTELTFEVDPAGPAEVRGCDFCDGYYQLEVMLAGTRILVAHREPLELRTRGRLLHHPQFV